MKITDIKTYLVRANDGGVAERPRGRNWLVVAVHTDEGIVGYGEGGGWPEVAAHGIDEIAPFLTIPTAPGLGIDLDLDEVARYDLLPRDRYRYRHRSPEAMRQWYS